MAEMRDSVDSYLTAYTSEGSDPVGYPFGQLPQYSTDDIPMAQTAYGATFGDLGRHRHRHHGGGRGPGPGWWGPWPWYQPFEVAGAIVQPEPVILDESGEPQRDEDEKKKKAEGVKGLSSFGDIGPWLQLLPLTEQKLVKKELANDQKRMMAVIGPLMGRDDFRNALIDSALRAVANEFDPTVYPEMAGYWPILRVAAHQIASDTETQINKMVEGMGPVERLALLSNVSSGMSGLGEDAAPDIWSTLIPVIGGLVTNVVTTRIKTDAAKDVERMRTQAATQQVALQTTMEQARAAMASAAGAMTAGAKSVLSAEVAGIPLPLLAGGVVAAGLIAYLALK